MAATTCVQFMRMFTLRNVAIILLLEVSFSFQSDSKQGSRQAKPPAKCAVISIDNAITRLLSADKNNPQPLRIVKNKQKINAGRRILYVCDQEYQVHGRDILACKQNGNWSHSPPACFAIPKTHAPPREVPTTGIRSTVTDKTTTSDNPDIDEGLTSEHEGFPSVATVEKAKTSEAFRVITITVATRTSPHLPMSTRFASSTVESQAPEFTTPEAELLQSVDAGDHGSHPTLKTKESTAPSSAPAFSSFPDDVMESDTTASNNLDRITRSSSGELTEAQGTSSFEMFNQDEETEEPDRRATETHQLFPDEELEEKVSTSDDAYETTSQKPFETEDSVATSAEMMVSESEEQDDTTPETRDLSSASGIGLKKIEDDDAELQSPTLESVSHYTVSQELLTVQSSSSRIQVPINEAETRRPPEESLSSITVESEDVNLPLGHDFTETDSKSQRSLIVTHFPTKTPTEGSSDKTLVMRPEEIPTNENKTGKTRSRSQSVLTTHVPPLNPSGYRSTPVSAPTIDSAAMTRGNSASIVLIVIIVAAVIVLVVLLSILGKALLPKCTLLQKPCNEQGAVPYTAQSNQPDQVVLKGINPMPENDSCTQV